MRKGIVFTGALVASALLFQGQSRAESGADSVDLAVGIPPIARVVPLVTNVTYSGAIATPAEQDRFAFTGTVGQRLYYDALDLDGESINARLTAPSGGTVWEINHSTDQGPFLLTQSGTYTLVFDGTGETTGDYSFRMLDPASATVIAYGPTNTGFLIPQSMTAMYRFSGTAGQRVNLHSVGASSPNANWRLISPANQTLVSGAINGNLGQVVLPLTGTNLVLVEGTTENIGSLEFQFQVALVSSPSGTTTGFGVEHSDDTTLGQIDTFNYTAPAGTLIFFDSLTNSSPATIQLVDPIASVVFSIDGSQNWGPYMLQRSGNYTVNVIGYGDGEYRFRLLNLVTDSIPLEMGTNYTQVLNPPWKDEFYRFTGAPGQRVYYDGLQGDMAPVGVQMYMPDLSVPWSWWNNADSDRGPLMLSQAGPCYLQIEGQTADLVDYKFRLLDASQPPTEALVFGKVHGTDLALTNAPIGLAGWWSGDGHFFDLSSNRNNGVGMNGVGFAPGKVGLGFSLTNGTDYVRIPAAPELNVGAGSGLTIEMWIKPDDVTAPHPLVEWNLVSGSYGAHLWISVPVWSGPGAIYANLEDTAGANHLIASAEGLVATQVWSHVALTYDQSAGVAKLYHNGTLVASNMLGRFTPQTSSDLFFGYRSNDGTHFDGQMDEVTIYSRALSSNDLATIYAAGSAGKDKGTGTVVRVADWATQPFRFTGVAGQRLYFDSLYQGVAAWNLYGADNGLVFSVDAGSDQELTLSQSGDYVLSLINTTGNVMPYGFRVFSYSATNTPLTLGSTVSGAISTPGQAVRYTFTGTAGQRLYYDALDGDNDAVTVQLLNPAGGVMYINGNADTDVGPFTLAQSGTYTLVFDASGEYTADYSFRLMDVAQPPTVPLAFGQTYGTNLSLIVASDGLAGWWPGDGHFFDLSANKHSGSGVNGVGFGAGKVGQAFSLDGADDAIQVADASTLDFGTNGFSVAAWFKVRSDQLTTNTEYGVLYKANGWEYTPGWAMEVSTWGEWPDCNVEFWMTSDSFTDSTYAASQSLDPNLWHHAVGVRTGTTIRLYVDGQLASERTDSTIGLTVDNDQPLLVGTSTWGPNFPGMIDEICTFSRALSSNEIAVLYAAGSAGGAMGTFDQVPEWAASPFRFTGTAGQRIYFDSLNAAYGYPPGSAWNLYNPDNGLMFNASPATDQELTLPASGTYVLTLANNTGGSMPYGFRVFSYMPTNTPMNVGSTVSGSIGTPGQDVRYTFTGTAGQRLYYDALDGDMDAVNVQLLDPSGSAVFISGNADTDVGPFSLTDSGTYTLVFKASGDLTADYRFRLIDVATAPLLLPDVIVSTNIAEPYGVDLYRFPTVAGMRLYLDDQGPYDYTATHVLYGPENQMVTWNYLGYDLDATPGPAGTYLVLLSKSVTNDVPYQFRILSYTATNNALTLGTNVIGMISTPGQEDRYVFTGTADQRLYYDALDGDMDAVNVQLLDPSGNVVFINGNADTDVGPFTLADSGTYTLVFKASGDLTADYRFRLIDVATAPLLLPDVIVSTNIAEPYGVDLYRFLAPVPNLRLYLDDLGPYDPSATHVLYGPENQMVTGNYLGYDLVATPGPAGTYLVLLSKSVTNDVPYQFRVLSYMATNNALTLGTSVTGIISTPGQEDRYVFTGTAGQRLYYDALDLDGENINARLVAPSGGTMWDINHSANQGPFLLTQSGTYTLVLDGTGEITGDYSFRMLDPASATVIVYGPTNTGSLTPQSMTAMYQFSGAAGQRVNLHSVGASSPNANWRLISPANQTLVSGAINGNLGQVVLPLTGTNLVLVEGTTENIGALEFQFQVALVSNPSGTATGFGVEHGGPITLGQIDTYNYTAPAGTVIFFDSLTNSSPATIQLVDPIASVVFSIDGSQNWGPYMLQRSGNYTVNVIGYGDGEYRFRLLNLATDSIPLVFGQAYTNVLDPPYKDEFYRFTGSASQRLFYDGLEGDGDAVVAQLLRPDFSGVWNQGGPWGVNNADYDIGPDLIPLQVEGGTCYLHIEGQTPDVVDAKFCLWDLAQPPAEALTYGQVYGNWTNTLPAGVATGLVAWWPGDGHFFDLSSNHLNGAGVGSVGFATGEVASCFLFDSDDDGVTVPHSEKLNMSPSGFTAEFWMKGVHDQPDTLFLLLDKSHGADYTGWAFQGESSSGHMSFGCGNGSDYPPGVATPRDLLDGSWHHVAGTWDGSTLAFYVDGNLESSQAQSVVASNSRAVNMAYWWGEGASQRFFRGMLDEVTIYSRALASNEVAAIYAAGSAGKAKGTFLTLPEWASGHYRFSGTAGQRLYVDSMNQGDGTPWNLYWNLYGPDDTLMFQAGARIDQELTLSQSGDYVLSLINTTGNVMPYGFRVLSYSATNTPLTLGSTVSGAISTPGQAVRYTFTGTAGQRLYYDALDGDNDAVTVQLLSPAGNAVFLTGGNADADVGPFTLAQSGTYTLVFDASGEYTADYKFRLLDVAQPPTEELTYGWIYGNWTNIVPPGVSTGLVAWWSGDGHFFDVSSNHLNGLGQGGIGFVTGMVGQAFSFDGTNAVVRVADTSALDFGTGDFSVETWINVKGDLLADSSEYGIANKNAYFCGTPGWGLIISTYGSFPDFKPVFFGTSAPNWEDLDLQPIADAAPLQPGVWYHLGCVRSADSMAIYVDGQLYAVCTNASAANSVDNVEPLVLGANPWGLPFAGQLDELALYSRALSSNEIATIYAAGSVGKPRGPFLTQPAWSSLHYRLVGHAGQRLYFDSMNQGAPYQSGTAWNLYNPDNGLVFSVDAGTDRELTLTQNGTYVLSLANNTGSAMPYGFRVFSYSATNTPLTLGSTVSGALSTPGQDARYTFTGTAGQRLYYDALDGDNDAVTVQLLSPAGNAVFLTGGNADTDVGPFTLAQSGTYTLVFDASGEYTADYSFRLMDVAQPPTVPLAFGQTYGTNLSLSVVPAGWLSITGSYVAASMRTYTTQDDWRVSQTIVGTRVDAAINFGQTDWGSLADVGLNDGNHGNDGDWENYSVQWDGWITITNAGTRLYLLSDCGSRMWVDVNGNGVFGDSPGEFVDGQWGQPSFGSWEWGRYSGATAALPAGTYRIRVQYEEGYWSNYVYLLTDSGSALEPWNTGLYRFAGTAGQRLYFDSLNSAYGFPPGTAWKLYNQDNGLLFNVTPASDQELTLTQNGTYVLSLANNTGSAMPYGFRVFSYTPTNTPMNVGSTVSGSIGTPGQDVRYTFTGTAGQRLYYDALDGDMDAVNVQLLDPSGSAVFISGNADTDVGPFSLTDSGTYTLVFKASGDLTADYRFRLIDVATAPLLLPDAVVSTNIAEPYGVHLYRFPTVAGMRLCLDDLGSYDYTATHVLYGPENQVVTWYYLGYDLEGTSGSTGTYFVLFSKSVTNDVPYSFRLLVGNHAPVLDLIGNKTVDEMTALTFTATATDFESPNDQLTFSLDPGAPAGATINANTGAFSWTPTEVQGPGMYTCTVRVADDGIPSLDDSETITITVNEINRAPSVFVPANQTMNEMTLLSVTNTATDPDIPTNSLSFSVLSAPDGVSINTNSGVLTWTPTEAQGPATNTITVVVTDYNPDAVNEQHLSATGSFQVVVHEVNLAPVLPAQSDRTVDELVLLTVTNTASDTDLPANGLSYVLAEKPAGAAISTAGVITWTPDEAAGPGTNVFRTVVTDDGVPPLSATNEFTVVVREVNTAPALPAQSDRTVDELVLLTVTNTASDTDLPANGLSYVLAEKPAGAAISTSGVITWTPDEAAGPGTNVFRTVVTDDGVPPLSATNEFTVVVREVNTAPALPAQSDRTVDELVLLTVTNTASDTDLPANGLSYVLAEKPAGAAISTTGVITWTPDEAAGPGTNVFRTVVTDDGVPPLSATNEFTVVVREVNTAPALPAQSDRTVDELVLLTVTNTASDTDLPANGLSYVLAEKPAGASISTTGVITWTPDEAAGPGTNVFRTVVTDDGVPPLSATNEFKVVVREVNTAPVLPAQSDRTVDELVLLTVTNTASDTDLPANGLSYVLAEKPAGAAISTTGVITWTPDEAAGPGTNVFRTVVTDDGVPPLSATNEFTVVVREVNTAPALPAQSDRTVDELVLLTVTNTASDTDLPANGLSYVLAEKPAGASISTTGVITWTPDEAAGPGTNVFRTVVTDDGVPPLSATNEFTVVVREVNTAPALPAQSDRTVDELVLLTVTNTASDTDLPANGLSYVLAEKPAGAAISTTGVITWTPDEAAGPGTNVFRTVVTDDGLPSLSATNEFTVVVREVNTAPALPAQSDRTVDELVLLTVTNTASDTDLPTNGLSYVLAEKPAGAAISTTGVITWTPDEAAGPGTNVFRTVVTDDGVPSLSATNEFTVVVREVNVPPTISVVSPTNAARLTPLADVVISTAAGDPDGNLARVEFYAGSNKLGELLTPPYEFVWTNVWPGGYTLTAQAWDLANATATSAPISVVVLPMWTNAQKQAGLVGFTLIGEVGATLVIEESADLQHWAPVSTNQVGEDGRLQWNIIPPLEMRNEFYRVRAP